MSVDPRWAEHQLAQHNERRRLLGFEQRTPALRTPWDTNPSAPAPVIRDSAHGFDNEGRPPSSQASKRAARFRDGLPPPPAPPPPPREYDVAEAMTELGLNPASPTAMFDLQQAIDGGYVPPTVRRQIEQEARRERAKNLIPQHLLDQGYNPDDPLVYHQGSSPSPMLSLTMTPAQMAHQQRTARPRKYPAPVRRYATTDEQPVSFGDQAQGAARPYPMSAPVPGPAFVGREEEPMSPTPDPSPSGLVPEAVRMSSLTPSQRRRMRRRKAQASVSGDGATSGSESYPTSSSAPPHVPQPQPQPQPAHTNGVYPSHPEIAFQSTCGSTVTLHLRGGPITLACPLKPFPHPGQPHLFAVPPESVEGASEMFIGWFEPGE